MLTHANAWKGAEKESFLPLPPPLQGALPGREGAVLSEGVAGPGGQRFGPVRPGPLWFQQSRIPAA